MKKAIIILSIVAAALTGCRPSQATLDQRRADISWNAFCQARGYDTTDTTYIVVNEYLDTWCESVDEEIALLEAGVEPY